MVKQLRKIVHVHFKETTVDEFFGSISGIYEFYGKEDIGYALRTLQEFNIGPDNPFENEKVIIKVSWLKQKTKRGE